MFTFTNASYQALPKLLQSRFISCFKDKRLPENTYILDFSISLPIFLHIALKLTILTHFCHFQTPTSLFTGISSQQNQSILIDTGSNYMLTHLCFYNNAYCHCHKQIYAKNNTFLLFTLFHANTT